MNELDKIYLSPRFPLNTKLSNMVKTDYHIVIESKEQYLERVLTYDRPLNVEVTIYSPVGIYPLRDVVAWMKTITHQKYWFDGGIEDINFVPIPDDTGSGGGSFIEDREWGFADVIAGTVQVYDIDVKAKWAYNILSVVYVTNTGTLLNVALKVNGVTVGGLGAVSATDVVTETDANPLFPVAIGDRVTISTSLGYTGSPTYIGGKIVIRRT